MLSILCKFVFTPGQILLIVAACVLFIAIVAVNVAVVFHLRKIRERKLCTHQLQSKRDELLRRLAYLQAHGVLPSDEEQVELPRATEVVLDVDDDDEAIVDDDDEGNDDDIDADDDVATAAEGQPDESDPESAPDADILAVREMSAKTRELLGYVGEEYDRKQYYVRYTLGFETKLREAEDEVKDYYKSIVKEIDQYKGVKVRASFRQQRIYKGTKTLGLIMIRGKTLCVAFALNPADYAETKYRGVDKSDKKRFAKTPMLFKITSSRKLEYAKYLLLQLAEKETIVLSDKPVVREFDLEEKTRDEMFLDKKLRLAILGEAPDLEAELDEPDEEVAEIVEETTIAGASSEKVVRRVLYNRSFAAKVIQANEDLKARYSEIKNCLMSYAGVTEKPSWKRESFKVGNKYVAAFAISGKTLCLFLAMDPEQFVDTKYAVENMTGRRNSGSTPAMYRVKGDRRTAYAKQLIDLMMQELKIARTDRRPVDYTTPYKSTASLVRRGLIKQSETDKALPAFNSGSADKPAKASRGKSSKTDKSDNVNQPESVDNPSTPDD